jgi:predicted GIY-YIG superfamily endonuclease
MVSEQTKYDMLMQHLFMVRWLNAHLNIGLPEDLYERIKKHKEIRWAAVARELLIQYLNELEEAKETQPMLALKKEKDEK